MRKSKRVAAMAFIATFGLIAAACGDDEKSETTTAATTEETTASTVAPSDLKLGVAGAHEAGHDARFELRAAAA